jgi:acyl carrier protein
MTTAPSFEQVRAIVAQIAGADRCPADAGAHTPLRDGGFWLDSASLLEVIMACEVEFGVAFDPETDFTDEALGTVGGLVRVIRAKRSG